MPRTLILKSHADRRGEKILLDNPNKRSQPTARSFTDTANLASAPQVIRDAHDAALEAFRRWQIEAVALGDAWEAWEAAPGRRTDADRLALANDAPMPKVDVMQKAQEDLQRAHRRETAAHARAAEAHGTYHALAVAHHAEWHAAHIAATSAARDEVVATIERVAAQLGELGGLISVAGTLHNFAGYRGDRFDFERGDRLAAEAARLVEAMHSPTSHGPRGFVRDDTGSILAALLRKAKTTVPTGEPALQVERALAAKAEAKEAERAERAAAHAKAANEREARRQERLRNPSASW